MTELQSLKGYWSLPTVHKGNIPGREVGVGEVWEPCACAPAANPHIPVTRVSDMIGGSG